ncbi:MAG: DnaD domain protein [Bacilli bacterium]|nr:DnaD domain protein [Bacilli bacterium]
MKNPYLNAVSFHYVLLDCYKRLGLSEEELSVILMIDHLIEQGNTFINSDMLALKMNLKPADIDKDLTELVKKNYLTYDTVEGKLTVSLSNLKDKVYSLFKETMDREASKLTDKTREKALSEIHSFFEGHLNRSLSPLEQSTINEWLDARYTLDEIKNALLDTLKSGKKSIRAIEKTLKSARKAQDILKEGSSAVSDTWDKDIEATIAIAKDLWGSK